jgi:glyoxylase-like metal-dependent hydrolase (beta-lactamase superfamily II)
MARLRAVGEFGAIEGLWISHYHDDHTQAVNIAKRRFGAKVYVQREMLDIIENPTAYPMPCLFPESIRVDRVVEDGETIQWKNFRLTFYYFPGQTIYHSALLVEKDRYKVLFTGDSIANWGVDDYCSQNRNFIGSGVGYEKKCFDLLLKIQPDMLVAAHWGAEPVSPEYVRNSMALFQRREALYRNLFPHDNVNFGLDPYWIRAYPFRQKVLPGARVAIESRIMNHASEPKTRSCMAGFA